MASRYTDVDLMILKRWDEVKALRGAFDDLVDRIQDTVEVALQNAVNVTSEKGLSSEFDLKRPSIWFWKREWANRKNEPGVYFQVLDFVPKECGKSGREHPSMWLVTDEFSNLKMRENGDDFGRAVKAALSPELLTKWNHHEAEPARSPLGLEYEAVSESDRVNLVANPDDLGKFIIERVDEFRELVPAVEQTLQKMTRK
jgi:hypothetical protein